MEDLEKIPHSESSEKSLESKNFFLRFLIWVWAYIKGIILFIYNKIEQISFWRAVFVGLALGFFCFGMMIFAIALWLAR